MDQGNEEPFPAMSPPDVKELSEEAEEKQNGLKQQGADALEDGKLDIALQKFSEAISVGCASALLYSRRAQLLMQLDRPRAAVNDCTAALAINPDSGKAYKIRARAYAKLEMWPEAHYDFSTGLKLDYDEGTYEESLSVAATMKELESVLREKRLKEEKDEYHRTLQKNKEAYEAGMKANEEKFREQRMKEEEEKKRKEDERRERVQQREKEEAAKSKKDDDEPGVPKAHAPTGAEDVD